MSNSELLVFALGPVQSFIATARRTQDLWLGSQVLSLLAQVGLEAVSSESGVVPLFPVRGSAGWPTSIPNRFVLQVPAGQSQTIASIIEHAIHTAWHSPQSGGIVDQVEQHLMKLTGADHSWRTIWRRQVSGWLETYWAAWPWDGVDGTYGDSYNLASRALMMRKHVRAYPTAAEPGERCSLCGVRQALCDPSRPELRAVRAFWAVIATRPDVTAAELRAGERLCAICTIKRFASRAEASVGGHQLKTERFPSTSSIAAAGFRRALITHWDHVCTDGPTLGQKVTAYLQLLRNLGPREGARSVRFGRPEVLPYLTNQLPNHAPAHELLHYDGDFFYSETLTVERLKELLGRDPNEQSRLEALSGLKNLLSAARACKISPPPIYLAVLALDGDRIGTTLSECDRVTQHITISQALSSFSSEHAPTIIEKNYPGRLIYAGGDDVLALLPLSADTSWDGVAIPDVLISADQLRATLTAVLKETANIEGTVSCGIALLHHMQPLEGGIRAAQRAEKQAKGDRSRGGYGRNALVVEVLRRSGEHQVVGMRWESSVEREPRVSLIAALRQAIMCGVLSGKIGYDLEQITPVFTSAEEDSALLDAACAAEIGRLFKRRAGEGEQIKVEAAALAERVVTLTESITIGEAAKWLLLARFLAQGGEI